MWVPKILSGILTLVSIQNVLAEAKINIHLTGPSTIIQCTGDLPFRPFSDGELSSNPVASKSSGGCPTDTKGFIQMSNSQCFRYASSREQWETGRALCDRLGMVMARPEDDIVPELSRALEEKLCNTNDYNCPNSIWLGARGSDDTGTMVWEQDSSELSNDSPLWGRLRHWGFEDFLNAASKEDYCLVTKLGSPTPFEAAECQHGYEHFATLCEDLSSRGPSERSMKKKTSGSRQSNAALPSVNCPESENFIKPQNNQCFRYFVEKVQWESGKRTCEDEGMVLAKPEDTIVADLSRTLKDLACPGGYNCPGGFWLGARGSDDTGTLVWEKDGTEISMDSPLWRKGQYFNYPSSDFLEFVEMDMATGWCLLMALNQTAPYEDKRCQHHYAHYPTLCEVV